MSAPVLYVILHRVTGLFLTPMGGWTSNVREAELHSFGSAYSETCRRHHTVLRERREYS
jgi:hypothetical protein